MDRELFLKGRTRYSYPPCAAYYIDNNIWLFHKTNSHHNCEVNSTEPSTTVSVPWYGKYAGTAVTNPFYAVNEDFVVIS
jgi:hypothetical protein